MEAIVLIIVLIVFFVFIFLSRNKDNIEFKKKNKLERKRLLKIKEEKERLLKIKEEQENDLNRLKSLLAIFQKKGDKKLSIVIRKKIFELDGNVDDLDANEQLIFNQYQKEYKEAKAKKDKENKLMRKWASKKTILLVEDDRDMRDLVSRHLKNSGFHVQKAEDGIKGKALALQYSPDLILLDLFLPFVDGYTFCQRLRRDEKTSNIPILMISALPGLEKNELKNKITGFNPETDDFIRKPFDLDELNGRIKKLIENKKKS